MNIWKYKTAGQISEIDKNTETITIYDDEMPGQITLYIANGDTRWPARSIDLSDIKRAAEILSAWLTRCPTTDEPSAYIAHKILSAA